MAKEYRGYEKTPPNRISIEQVTLRDEPRFIIVDADTGEVYDDAQGYGYRSAEKADSAFRYGVYRRKMYA